MMILAAVLATCAVLTSASGRAEALTLHVAPDGRDTWSGRLAAPAADGRDGPLATLAGARDAIRQLRDAGEEAPDGFTVLVREGTYYLDEPFVLEPQDSGRAEAPVVYEAFPGERPVISGGRRITGWREGPGGIWSAPVPGDADEEWRFLQLFVNGERRTLARTPNEGYFTIQGKAAPLRDPETGRDTPVDRTAFVYAAGDIKAWPDPQDVHVVVYHSWETSRHRIERVDEATRTVHFTGPAVWPFLNWGPNQRYYVENAPDALDAPGEWRLDREAGIVRYIPLPGEDMTTAEVVAPRLRRLVELRGEPGLGLAVDSVIFRGLAFHHQDWALAPEGHSDPQAVVRAPAAIMADGAFNCAFEDCELAHIGDYAIWLRRGCKHNRIQRCVIRDLGTGGVRIGESVMADSDAEESSHNLVDNNHIHDGGHVYAGGVGIWVAQSSHNRISHNELHDFNYSGLSIGWNWNDAPNRCHHNIIEFNHVHHVMNGALNDGGAIYTLGTSPGSVIRNNVFHDVWPCSAIGWGIYLDSTTNGYLVEDNIVYNTLSGGLMKHNGGHENVIQNNVFAFTAHQMLWPCWEVRPNTFRRNIIYFTQGDLFIPMAESRLRQRLAADEPLGEWDHNLYWNPNQPDLRFFSHDFSEWQEMGLDGSSVIADPQFADPDAYDFSLRPTSPALALGFRAIDTSRVGLYGDPEWVARADRVAHPPTVLPPPPQPPGPAPVDDDFETTAVGSPPEGAVVSGEEKGASIRVSDEQAAGGIRSLKFTDVPGLEHTWQPHMFYQPRFTSGPVRQSFDIWIGPGVHMFTQWRDRTPYPDCIGPSVTITADGAVTAGGRVLTTVPVGEWVHVIIEAEVGRGAPKTFTLTVGPSGQEGRRFEAIPFTGAQFRELHWLGFVSEADGDAVFYVDNIRIAPGDPQE